MSMPQMAARPVGISPTLRALALGRALSALETNRPAAAEVEAGAWLAAHPGDTEAMLLLGLAIATQGDAERAAPCLRDVARRRPGFAHPCRDLIALCPGAPALVDAQFRPAGRSRARMHGWSTPMPNS